MKDAEISQVEQEVKNLKRQKEELLLISRAPIIAKSESKNLDEKGIEIDEQVFFFISFFSDFSFLILIFFERM